MSEILNLDSQSEQYEKIRKNDWYRKANRYFREKLPTFPTVVCLCGSTRFISAFQRANLQETLAGRIVLSVGCNTQADGDLFGTLAAQDQIEMKTKLDELHKRKIDLADEVLILNVDGYIGESTRSELEYAQKTGKVIRFLDDDLSSISID